jgi:hypothetical protein
VVRFPDHDLSLAVFCNLSTTVPGELTRQVADLLLPASSLAPWPAPAAASQAPDTLAGIYWNPVTDDVRRVRVVDGALRFATNAPPLVSFGNGRFRAGERGAEILFPLAQPGMPQELHLPSPTMPPAVFRRLAPLSGPVDLAPFAGRYHSSDLGATYEVVADGKNLIVKRPRVSDLVLEPIAPNQFVATSNSPTVTFSRSGNTTTGMTISMGRVRRLPFTRAGTS